MFGMMPMMGLDQEKVKEACEQVDVIFRNRHGKDEENWKFLCEPHVGMTMMGPMIAAKMQLDVMPSAVYTQSIVSFTQVPVDVEDVYKKADHLMGLIEPSIRWHKPLWDLEKMPIIQRIRETAHPDLAVAEKVILSAHQICSSVYDHIEGVELCSMERWLQYVESVKVLLQEMNDKLPMESGAPQGSTIQ